MNNKIINTKTNIEHIDNHGVINIGSSQTKVTQQLFKSHYQTHFKTISLLINDNAKPIEDIFVNLAIIKEEKEETKKDKLINREAFLSSYEEIHKPKEPIAIEELIDKSKKSLIYGKAGIGKTTLCKYIAYKWAKGELYQEFEYVIYIPLREWRDGGVKGAIKDYYYSRDTKDISIDIESNRIFFLFDGYDELDAERKKILRDEIFKNHLSYYIITSRPYGYVSNEFGVDEQFETIGFTDENVDSYIEKYFSNKSEQQSLKNFLKININIKHIAYIPLMLEMICTLWEDKSKNNQTLNSPMTMTELYSDVVEYILNRYSAKKDDQRVYKRKNRRKIKEYLGKIAFEGLKRQKILFDGDFIEEIMDDTDFFEENIIYSGFLKSDNREKDLLDNSFEFPHLTFQEYFSALYVSKLSKEEISEIVRDYKFYPYMQVFFAFLGGLIGDKEFLLEEIESEPKDRIKAYEILLSLNCLGEIKENNLGEKKKESINTILIKWLEIDSEYIFRKSPIFLKRLTFIKHFLKNNLLDKLFYIIKNKNYFILYRTELAEKIIFLGKDNDDFINKTIYILMDENIELSIKLNLIDILIENDSIDLHVRIRIVKKLVLMNKKINDKSIDVLIKIFNDKKINLKVKNKIKEILILLSKDNKKIMYFFQKDNNYSNKIKELIFLAKKDNNAFMDIMINHLEKTEIPYNEIVKIFSILNRSDDIFINKLVKIIDNEKIGFFTKMEILDILFSIFKNKKKLYISL